MGRENHWAHMSAPINRDMLSDIKELHDHLSQAFKGFPVKEAHEELLANIELKYCEADGWIE